MDLRIFPYKSFKFWNTDCLGPLCSHSLLSPSDILRWISCSWRHCLLNSRRTIRSQLYCLLEFELLKYKQWRRPQICFCAVSSEWILACSRLSVVPLRRFLRITCHPKATRTYLSFKGMILRLRQEKYGKNLAVFRCYYLSANCNYTLTTFKFWFFFLPFLWSNGFLSFIYHLSAMRT